MDARKVRSMNVTPELAKGQNFYDALVLDARQRQSLVSVRSLGSRSLRVAAMETVDGLPVPAFSSRWCQQRVSCTAREDTEEYLLSLEQVLDGIGVGVLITSSDGTVALIRQHRKRLEQRVRVALAKEPALGIAINKEQTLEIARMLGLNVPRGVSVGAVSEVGAAVREIGLPAVIKPVESWVGGEGKGSRFTAQSVTTADEARRVVEELTRLGGATLFQQFLSGRREAMSFLYANGQIHARFAQWAKRTHPPLGGGSVLRQSIAIPPDIGEQAERLVREIELEAYSEVEFRRDSAGRPYLMEINPRLSASVELAVRAGVDFPYLLYQWATGQSVELVTGYRMGIWMRHLGGDIATTLATIRQRGHPGVMPPLQAILEFCTTFLVPMRYDYLDWQDPLPAWIATLSFPRHLLMTVRKRTTIYKGKEDLVNLS